MYFFFANHRDNFRHLPFLGDFTELTGSREPGAVRLICDRPRRFKESSRRPSPLSTTDAVVARTRRRHDVAPAAGRRARRPLPCTPARSLAGVSTKSCVHR